MVKAAELAQAGFKYIGRSYEEMDCQKFVERCLKDCGNSTDLPGSNAWYRKMTWTGTPEECRKKFGSVPAGAFLFILEHDGKEPEKYRGDGIGNASHIGIVTGTGEGAIHSSHSRGGVCESKFKGKTIPNGGWNRVGLWKEVDYGPSVNWLLGWDDETTGTGGTTGGGEEAQMQEKATAWAESGSTVNMRKRASTDAGLLDRVPIGDEVTILEKIGDWCRVRWNGRIGYIMTQFLKTDGTEGGTGGGTAEGDAGGAEAESDGEILLSLTREEREALPVLKKLIDRIADLAGRG